MLDCQVVLAWDFGSHFWHKVLMEAAEALMFSVGWEILICWLPLGVVVIARLL